MALPEDKQLGTLLDYMVAQASEAASIDDLSPDQPLLELGLDSLRAAQFAVQVTTPPMHPLHAHTWPVLLQSQCFHALALIGRAADASMHKTRSWWPLKIVDTSMGTCADPCRLSSALPGVLTFHGCLAAEMCRAGVQIEEHLGLQVPFTAIFQYPTLRQLAAHILCLLRTPESAPICALQEAETGAFAFPSCTGVPQCMACPP